MPSSACRAVAGLAPSERFDGASSPFGSGSPDRAACFALLLAPRVAPLRSLTVLTSTLPDSGNVASL